MRWLVALALSVFSLNAGADTLTPDMRREDARLQARVAVHGNNLFVRELLDEVSRQSGIVITASDRDGAGDSRVFASVQDVPAGDVMDALWSLLSYKGASWHWDRSTANGKFVYRLEKPLAARNFAVRMRDRVQQMFEAEADRIREAVATPPDVLGPKAKGDRRLEALLNFPQHRAGLDIFFHSVPRDVQQKVLRGEVRSLKIALADAPESARTQILSQAAREGGTRIINGGPVEPTPPPTFVVFECSKRAIGGIAPGLGMQVEGHGGGDHLGGLWLENEIDRELAAAWMLDGDSKSSPLLDKAVPSAEKLVPPLSSTAPGDVLRRRLSELSAAAPLAILARLPTTPNIGSSFDPGEPYGRTVAQTLDKVTELGIIPIQTKWRGSVLLLAYPGWIKVDINAVSAGLIARLRKEYRENRGVISIALLAEVAATLSEDAIRSLQPEFSVMGNVAYWRDLLALYHTQPQAAARLRDRFGLAIDNDVAALLSSLKYSPRFIESVRDKTAAAFRMEEIDRDIGHEVAFGIVTLDGRWIPMEGLMQRWTEAAPNK